MAGPMSFRCPSGSSTLGRCRLSLVGSVWEVDGQASNDPTGMTRDPRLRNLEQMPDKPGR